MYMSYSALLSARGCAGTFATRVTFMVTFGHSDIRAMIRTDDSRAREVSRSRCTGFMNDRRPPHSADIDLCSGHARARGGRAYLQKSNL